MISNPSEINPIIAAKNMARLSDSAGVSEGSGEGTRGDCDNLGRLELPKMIAVAAITTLMQAATRTDPDWPKSRSRNVAQR